MKANFYDSANNFWIGKVNSRRGPAELSYIRPQELIQEVLEMNQFLVSGFAQPLIKAQIEKEKKRRKEKALLAETYGQ